MATGPPREVSSTDTVDRTNAITQRVTIDGSSAPQTAAPIHEAAGNHAHHIIPQEFRIRFAKLGVNVDNPIFGQWIAAEEHIALHAKGVYNREWELFLKGLEKKGIGGDEAYRRIARYITENADRWGFHVPFPR